MSDKTGIGWTDATWNPIRGCTRVSKGCQRCYAETVAHRHGGPGRPYEGLTTNGRWNGAIKVVDEHLIDPLRWQRPRRVFVNSMSDLFHENVADETIDRIFAVMALAGHVFQVLTKRPERMLNYMRGRSLEARWMNACATVLQSWPPLMDRKYCVLAQREPWVPLRNVWLGVSVENQATADARIPLLLQTPAAVRFISAEPLLGPIDLHHHLWSTTGVVSTGDGYLDWVIVGGESGPGARPCRVEWVRDIKEQCETARVAVFVKQLGARVEWGLRGPSGFADGARFTRHLDGDGGHFDAIALKDRKGADIAEWPADLRVQQYPGACS